jgi:hypothetical protein
MIQIRIRTQSGTMDPNPDQSDKLDPKSDLRQFAEDMPQCMYMSLFGHFLKVSSLYLEARIRIVVKGRIQIRIRIKVTSKIRIRIKVASSIRIRIGKKVILGGAESD